MRKHNSCFTSVLILLVFIGSIGFVQSQTLEKSSVFALLTINIARFTRWPAWALQGEGGALELCLVGDSARSAAFFALEGERVQHRTLHITNLHKLHHITRCHILFISGLKRSLVAEVIHGTQKQPILTVGEGRGFARQGGIVAFDIENQRPKLIINYLALKQAHLMIDARILKLAEIVEIALPDE